MRSSWPRRPTHSRGIKLLPVQLLCTVFPVPHCCRAELLIRCTGASGARYTLRAGSPNKREHHPYQASALALRRLQLHVQVQGRGCARAALGCLRGEQALGQLLGQLLPGSGAGRLQLAHEMQQRALFTAELARLPRAPNSSRAVHRPHLLLPQDSAQDQLCDFNSPNDVHADLATIHIVRVGGMCSTNC